MTAPISLEPSHGDEALAIGEYDGVVVYVWRGRPTRTRLELAVEGFAAIARRAPGPLSLVAVIEEHTDPPALADLAFSAGAFDRFAETLVAAVAVLEERSATGALLDAVARVHALRRRPTPSKFCSDVREAAAWLTSRHPHRDADPVFRAGLVRAVEQVRATLPR